MSKRFASYLACLAAIGWLMALAASAQEGEEPEWSVKWSDGHKLDSSDKAFKLKFGGRIQADYIFASQNDDIDETLGEDAFQNGFQFRRARLFFQGTLYERVKFKAQYDFAGGDVDFNDVWIGLATRKGDVRFGHFKEPLSLNELTSSRYIAFLERALPVELFTPARNSGLGYSASNDDFTWGVGAFYDADNFGTSLNQDRYNVSGRLVWRPLFEDQGMRLLHVGLDVSAKQIEEGGTLRFRGRPGNSFGPRPIDTEGVPADDAQLLGI